MAWFFANSHIRTFQDSGGSVENVVSDRRIPGTLRVFASESDLKTRNQVCNGLTMNLCKTDNGGCDQVNNELQYHVLSRRREY